MENAKSIRFTVVGLGRCGGLIAASFARRGYSAVAVNTSFTDLGLLSNLPESARVYAGIDQRDGTGKDVSLGEFSLRENEGQIRKAVREASAGSEALLICGGVGGGTGACLHVLLDVLASLELPTLVAMVLPAGDEPGPVKVNAVRATERLLSSGTDGILALDAGGLEDAADGLLAVPGDPFVRLFDEINELPRRHDLRSYRTFDGEDLRRVMFAGRFVTIGGADLDPTAPLSSDVVAGELLRLGSGVSPFAGGCSAEDAAFASLVVMMPWRMIARTPGKVLEDAVRLARRSIPGVALYLGLYAYDGAAPRVLTMTSGMPVPESVHRLADRAREDGTAFCKRLGAGGARLDVGPLERLSLFGAAFERRRGEQRAPRPGAQTTQGPESKVPLAGIPMRRDTVAGGDE